MPAVPTSGSPHLGQIVVLPNLGRRSLRLEVPGLAGSRRLAMFYLFSLEARIVGRDALSHPGRTILPSRQQLFLPSSQGFVTVVGCVEAAIDVPIFERRFGMDDQSVLGIVSHWRD
jgi:hypothetical protein